MNTIIKLNPGPQAPPVCTGLSNTTFVPVSGQVIFTSPIKLGNTNGVTFDGSGSNGGFGFGYSGSQGSIFDPGVGNNQNLMVKGFDFGNTAGQAFDCSTKIYVNNKVLTYDGTPQSCVYYNLIVDGFKCSGKTVLMTGTYDPPPTYHMYVVGVTFKNGTFLNDKTAVNTKISGNSIFALTVDTWHITGDTINLYDCGIIFISGNANIKNVYRNGGWGYLLRLLIVKLAGIPFDQTCAISNCIDVNSTHYGTADVRNQTDQLASKAVIALTGGDFYFTNNTCGDKVDGPVDNTAGTPGTTGAGQYVTNAVVLGSMKDDIGTVWPLHIKNNIAWNADIRSGMSGGSSLLKVNAPTGTYSLDASNNVDLPPAVPLPTGYFIDKVNFVPLPGGLIDGKNIGAVQTVVTQPVPPVNNATPGPEGPAGPAGKDGVNGKDGAPGKDGINGTNGKDGLPGKDGRGIASISVIITYTDGTTQTLQ